jgi:hypothetical protein
VVLLLGMSVLGPGWARSWSMAETVRLIVAFFALWTIGWTVGAPLAAALRMCGSWQPARIGWCWGVHSCGWAFGAALAAVIAFELGVAALYGAAALALAAAGALMWLGGRYAA